MSGETATGGARILDGKATAAAVRTDVAAAVERLKARGVRPGLSVVLVGEDPASQVYVRNKDRAAQAAGFAVDTVRLSASTLQAELEAVVRRLNEDAAVHGVLVQLPLPDGLDADAVVDALDPAKDVDGLTAVNVAALVTGREGLVPCTPAGCLEILDRHDVPLKGRDVVIVGRSMLVGKPLAQLCLARHATVTVCHSRTRDLAGHCRRADVLVAAVGRARLVQGDWVAPGAVVLDVGINRQADGKLCGDVDFEAARAHAGAITPVPGGIGPMTIAMLLSNTALAAARQAGLDPATILGPGGGPEGERRLSDRDYWREPPPGRGGFAGGPQLGLPTLTPMVKRLLVANAAVFGVLFLVLMVAGRAAAGEVVSWFALDAAAWRSGFPLVPVWQLATYGFLHSLDDPWHILWNMLLLYFLGTMLEGILGGRRFLVLYLACLLSGGLLQILIDLVGGWSPLVLGASGAVLGVVVATAVLRPHTQVLVLFIPVTLKWLAIIVVGIDMFMALSTTRAGTTTGTAHWVHLGGAAWGGLAAWKGWIWRDPVQNFQARRKLAVREEEQRKEERVDELLQKIHREGIHSLSRRERDFLKKVSERR